METVLITGGAGFIGSHTADLLLERGYHVRALDSLLPQVHSNGERPDYLAPDVELLVGDVCDPDAVRRALRGASYVYHFAAETGVGQSMYELKRHYDTNVTGTAVLWQEIQKDDAGIKKLILSSSRAVYGEGPYQCRSCSVVYPSSRSKAQLLAGDWSPKCPRCGNEVSLMPVVEDMACRPVSIYGLTKRMQEDTCRFMGSSLDIPVVILRYFNVYGPRQSFSNPYTGVISNFFLKASAGAPVTVYEDGLPVRDFVHVLDVVQANVKALDLDTDFALLNVGRGEIVTLTDLASRLFEVLDLPKQITVSRKFRVGDIFGSLADISRIEDTLGYRSQYSLKKGLESIRETLPETMPEDKSKQVEDELRNHGLLFN